MAKQSMMKSLSKLLSPSALQRKLKFMLRGNNMNRILFLVAVLLVLYLVYVKFLAVEGFESDAGSFEDDIAGSDDKTIVMFYADWCGHCKKLKPVWDETAKVVNGDEENGCKLIKVNCGDPGNNESHKALMDKYGIKGYPTIKVFENGESKEYEGERTKEGILSYLGL